ncbi:MAG: protein translocase subunit SecD, partial [Actinobacteria bacterium]|nr:protein translocase subunit SecD [Actinomycetota bacterium]
MVGGIPDDPTMFLATCGKDTRARMILAPARVLGTQIANASAGVNQQDNATWQVNLTFDSSGAKDFATTTTELAKLSGVQNRLGIILDGLVVSSPSVNESILGGKAQITGKFSVQDAQNLANMLKYGALPVSLDVASQSQLSPTLGSDQLQGGLLAGLIGLIIVVIYLLVYYRALGVVAFVSLLVAAMLTYFSVVILGQQIGMALTLAG